ncbi:hypothetical protein FS837_000927 [Tulasnella sp. UAMH 9824]|nr:hypothetical protein FS837_000927 [Tulasnella sp. UAMH 9824]
MPASEERPGRDSPFPYSTNGTGHFVFLIIFLLAWIIHIVQAVRFKSLFMWVILVVGAAEWVGYALSICAIAEESPSSYLPASQVLLVATPTLLVAQSYIIIERMMDFIGKEYGPVRHNEITKVFFGLDMIAMALQAVGVSMLEDAVGKPHQAQVGNQILVVGLLLQVITFGIYTAWVTVFDFLSSRDPALRPYKIPLRSLRMLWIAFYASAVLITIRTIYRIVAFVNVVPSARGLYNQEGDLFNEEWSLYGFESIPILVSLV